MHKRRLTSLGYSILSSLVPLHFPSSRISTAPPFAQRKSLQATKSKLRKIKSATIVATSDSKNSTRNTNSTSNSSSSSAESRIKKETTANRKKKENNNKIKIKSVKKDTVNNSKPERAVAASAKTITGARRVKAPPSEEKTSTSTATRSFAAGSSSSITSCSEKNTKTQTQTQWSRPSTSSSKATAFPTTSKASAKRICLPLTPMYGLGLHQEDYSRGGSGRGSKSKSKSKKYYAVARGRRVGVYDSWAECEPMVKGFAGARHRSFESREAALQFVKEFRDLEAEARQLRAEVAAAAAAEVAEAGAQGEAPHTSPFSPPPRQQQQPVYMRPPAEQARELRRGRQGYSANTVPSDENDYYCGNDDSSIYNNNNNNNFNPDTNIWELRVREVQEVPGSTSAAGNDDGGGRQESRDGDGGSRAIPPTHADSAADLRRGTCVTDTDASRAPPLGAKRVRPPIEYVVDDSESNSNSVVCVEGPTPIPGSTTASTGKGSGGSRGMKEDEEDVVVMAISPPRQRRRPDERQETEEIQEIQEGGRGGRGQVTEPPLLSALRAGMTHPPPPPRTRAVPWGALKAAQAGKASTSGEVPAGENTSANTTTIALTSTSSSSGGGGGGDNVSTAGHSSAPPPHDNNDPHHHPQCDTTPSSRSGASPADASPRPPPRPASSPPLRRPPPHPLNAYETDALRTVRQVVYVDGSCTNNHVRARAAAGYGGFYGHDAHPHNFACPLPPQEPQTNNRAELRALIHALQRGLVDGGCAPPSFVDPRLPDPAPLLALLPPPTPPSRGGAAGSSEGGGQAGGVRRDNTGSISGNGTAACYGSAPAPAPPHAALPPGCPPPLRVYTDSRYVIDGLLRYAHRWERNGYRLSSGAPVLNADLWRYLVRLRGLYDELCGRHGFRGAPRDDTGGNGSAVVITRTAAAAASLEGAGLELLHVKGHANVPGNEKADRLAKKGAERFFTGDSH